MANKKKTSSDKKKGTQKRAVAKTGKKGHVPKMIDPPAPPPKKKNKK